MPVDKSAPLIDDAGGTGHVPDADGFGTDSASLRAECTGNVNGQVYKIRFATSDGKD